MDSQLSFATLAYAGKKKRTKRDVLLAEMAAAVPWSVLEAVIAPDYPKQGTICLIRAPRKRACSCGIRFAFRGHLRAWQLRA
jgi:hypothetical protein